MKFESVPSVFGAITVAICAVMYWAVFEGFRSLKCPSGFGGEFFKKFEIPRWSPNRSLEDSYNCGC